MDGLPEWFPTHRHDPAFWEALGRAVGTFGFLEEILGKAIFAFTATRRYGNNAELQQAYDEWLPKLERALTDPLGNLIEAYGKAVHEHTEENIANADDLLAELRKASDIRNVLCHGSWQSPDANGASLPLFVNRQKLIFDTAIDRQFLLRVQQHTAKLACAVMNTVTTMGWRFPGSAGPGISIDVASVSTCSDILPGRASDNRYDFPIQQLAPTTPA
ncbi:MAG: hypothetical protein ABI625_17625 [bacterium]